MKETLNLIEFLGKPSYIQKDGNPSYIQKVGKGKIMRWDAVDLEKIRPLFYSVYYEDGMLYASVVVDKDLITYPLIYNVSYSAAKQLLVIKSQNIHEILFSLSIALGFELKYSTDDEVIYDLLYRKVTDQYKNMEGGYWLKKFGQL